MKNILMILALLATVSVAYGQGQIAFLNKVAAVNIDAPISYDASGPAPAGRINGAGHYIVGDRDWGGVYARAGLYGGAAGTPVSELPFLSPAVPFRTSADSSGYVDPYFSGGSYIRTVEGVSWQPAIFQIRVWDAGVTNVNSYEDAITYATQGGVYLGVSQIVYVDALQEWEPFGPSLLRGLQPFSITFVPEPSPLVLAILGIGILMTCRCRFIPRANKRNSG